MLPTLAMLFEWVIHPQLYPHIFHPYNQGQDCDTALAFTAI